jgi:hypothetical protein
MLFTSACGRILMWTFGFRNPANYTEKDILKEAKKQKIPGEDVFVLDTSVNQFLSRADTNVKAIKWMVKNHIQPAQALYYNSEGNLISFHINCYAKGLRTRWNYNGAFDRFPPGTSAPVDTLMSLNGHLNFIEPLNGREVPDVSGKDFVVIVYFNRLIRNRGRRLVKTVCKNAALNTDKKAAYLFVNTDHFWYYCTDIDMSEF